LINITNYREMNYMQEYKTYGDKLREMRIRSRLTLDQVAKGLEVSLNTVYRWEHNLAFPRKSKREALARYYSIPMNVLESSSFEITAVNEVEPELLGWFRQLSQTNKYKVIGYIERLVLESSQEV